MIGKRPHFRMEHAVISHRKARDLGHLVKLPSRAEPRVGIRATSRHAEGSGAYEHIDETIDRRVGLDTTAY